MKTALIIAAVYVAVLWVKAALALGRRRCERPAGAVERARVTVIQPVTSGDERLEQTLRRNLVELHVCSFIWIADASDAEAIRLCRILRAEHPGRGIVVLETAEPPAGKNPKLWKQQAALPYVRTELITVVDDDTVAPGPALDLLVARLDEGADLATGLPCYVPARGPWSRLVAEFVNSAAILTYLPATALAAPVSINGMFYAVRAEYVRKNDLFGVTARAIADDLAIAREIRRRGGWIVQTTQPHFISTTVPSAARFGRLMHRWFVFTRLLVQNERPGTALAIILAFGLHPLLLAALTVLAIMDPWPVALCLVMVLAVRSATIAGLNKALTGAWRHEPAGSLLNELLQPGFLLVAGVHPVIWWRKRRIRVRSLYDFEYLLS